MKAKTRIGIATVAIAVVAPTQVASAAHAVVAAIAATVKHHSPGAAVTAAELAVARHGGILNCRQLEALWESAGGSPSAAFTAAEIAEAESSGRQYASHANNDGSVDRGYWQINSTHGSLSTFGVYGNARAAVLISSDGTDWTPWVTYNTGAYRGQC